MVATDDRDDLLGECVDKVEVGFDAYLHSTNGNPLTYDTVRVMQQAPQTMRTCDFQNSKFVGVLVPRPAGDVSD